METDDASSSNNNKAAIAQVHLGPRLDPELGFLTCYRARTVTIRLYLVKIVQTLIN
jgi:hypothetical protein